MNGSNGLMCPSLVASKVIFSVDVCSWYLQAFAYTREDGRNYAVCFSVLFGDFTVCETSMSYWVLFDF